MKEVKCWAFKMIGYPKELNQEAADKLQIYSGIKGYVGVHPAGYDTVIVFRKKAQAIAGKNTCMAAYPDIETSGVTPVYVDSQYIDSTEKQESNIVRLDEHERDIYERIIKNDKQIISNLERMLDLKESIIKTIKERESKIIESYEKRIRELTKELNAAEAQMRKMEKAMHGGNNGLLG